MTEEINCLNCGYYNADRCERLGGCFHHSKWQPIQKAPSFQVTEEEARKLARAMHGGCESFGHDEDYYIENLKQAGYIHKSDLVELVEEAEKLYGGCVFYDENSVAIQKMYSAIQALKKDHPEFGEKK